MATEYELVGGQPVKVTPLEATEAGTYKAPQGQAFNPVTVTGGGGGGLPPITPTDDGSFPVAQDGAWSKVGGYGVGTTNKTIIPSQKLSTSSMGGGVYVAQEFEGSLELAIVGGTAFVTYNGTEYQAEIKEQSSDDIGTIKYLGEFGQEGPVFTNYPFLIADIGESKVAYTTASKPTISVEADVRVIVPTDDFKEAVAAGLPSDNTLLITFTLDENDTLVADVPFSSVQEALKAGNPIKARRLWPDGKTAQYYTLVGVSWNEYSSYYSAVRFSVVSDDGTNSSARVYYINFSASGVNAKSLTIGNFS